MAMSDNTGIHPAQGVIKREELLRLFLMGLSLREICAQTKRGYNTIRKHARDPEFLLLLKEHSGEIAKRLVDELSTSQVEMAQRLEDASAAALEDMMEMMGELKEKGASKLRLQLNQDLLDRDPKSSRTKRMDITGTMSHDFISPAVLIHAAATAKEIEKFTPKLKEDNGNGSGHSADS